MLVSLYLAANSMNSNSSKLKAQREQLGFIPRSTWKASLPAKFFSSQFHEMNSMVLVSKICEYVYPVECEAIRTRQTTKVISNVITNLKHVEL